MVNVAENPSIDAQNEPASDHTKKKQRRHLKLLWQCCHPSFRFLYGGDKLWHIERPQYLEWGNIRGVKLIRRDGDSRKLLKKMQQPPLNMVA